MNSKHGFLFFSLVVNPIFSELTQYEEYRHSYGKHILHHYAVYHVLDATYFIDIQRSQQYLDNVNHHERYRVHRS